MPRAVLALLLLVALPVWAAAPKDLTWSEMIPPDAAPEVPNMTPLHDMSKMSDALSAESAPAAKQAMPNAPVVTSLSQVRRCMLVLPCSYHADQAHGVHGSDHAAGVACARHRSDSMLGQRWRAVKADERQGRPPRCGADLKKPHPGRVVSGAGRGPGVSAGRSAACQAPAS